VESALSQDTAEAIVVHCIDDASVDASFGVISELADRDDRVRAHRNPENLGVAATRNRAIRMGDADTIAFLDQDDVWTPGKLAAQLAVLTARPEVGFVVAHQQMIVEPGESMPAWCRPQWFERPQVGYLPGTLVVRRSTFEFVGYLDESLRAGGDDPDWFARARRIGVPSVLLDDVLLLRYVHDSNLSSDLRTDTDLLAIVRRHAERARPAEEDGRPVA
jgi:GT2 family glycosyltransferase